MNTNVLEVSELSVSFLVDEEYIKCVRNVSFTVKAGECLAIVGESGCGKSVTAKSVMGLIRQQNGKISKNSRILFENEDMLNNDKKQWTQVRGKDIAMVFQDSMSALNPTMRIGKQIEEILLNHKICKKSDAKKKTIQLLKKVGIPYAEKRSRQYPHEFSGGMRQRIMIAMAIACNPRLLIADEPTTALDVVVQAQILEMLKRLQKEENMSIILVTHDFGVVARMADRVAVMYSGSIVEQGSLKDIYYRTKHPYTRALLKSQPRLNDRKGKELYTLEGPPPILKNIPEGCPFCFRCENAMNICVKKMPKATDFNEEHKASCWLFHNENVRSEGEING